MNNPHFDVIIIGGSYAGLSAAMALGRSLRRVLIIDSGRPCNQQTPHSHNFLTQDGRKPAEITAEAKAQVLRYDTVTFHQGLAVEATRIQSGFEIRTQPGEVFTGRKLLFATGVADQMLPVKGFAECWGISVLHCPYCHGYEVKNQNIGLIGNGDLGFELCRLLSNWSSQLMLFTNGKSTLSDGQTEKLRAHRIEIVEGEIVALQHSQGFIRNIAFADGSQIPVSAVFARVSFRQHCDIPQRLGCELTESGHLKVNEFQKTNLPGVFAAGDNTTMFRTVSMATAAGTIAGASINKELIDESF
jgi:thioredoxin reductase